MSNGDLSKNRLPSEAPAAAQQRCLLIVDDDPRICRALSRRLSSSFDALFTATTPEEADLHLENGSITHLICDHNLGNGAPNGIALVARWRRVHPSIERAVLFTGTQLDDTAKPAGLDAIVVKTTDFSDLTRALGQNREEGHRPRH